MVRMHRLKPSWRWFEPGLLIVGLALHVYIALSPADSLMKWYSTDDAFYYYKVAMNITSGNGVTFDGINPTNGFHPLWMLICIPVFWLGKFDLILPLRALVLVSAILSIGTGVLLFRLLKKYISIEISAMLAVVWVFQPFIRWIVVMNGMESTVSAFFIAAFFYLVMHWQDEEVTTGKLIRLGLVGGLTILARLDNIFIVMLLGCWFVLKPLGSYVRNLIVSDLAMIFIAGLLSYFIRLRAGLFYQEYSISLSSFLALAFLLKPLLFYSFGRYRPINDGISRIRSLVQTLLAVTVSSLLIACGQLLLHYFNLVETLPRSATIIGQIIIIDWAGTLLGAWVLQLVIGGLALSSSSDEQDKPWELRSLDVWKSLLLRGFWLYIPVAALVGIFMLWGHFYVGASMPVSGQIKHWWAGLPNTVYGSAIKNNRQLFGLNAWELAFSYFISISGWVRPFFNLRTGRTVVLAVNALVGVSLLILAISHRRMIANLLLNRMGLFVIFLGLYVHIFYYTSTSYVHTRQWYWVGEMFFTVLLLGILLESLRMTLEQCGIGKWIWNPAMLVVVAAVVYSSMEQNARHFPYQVQPGKQDSYLSEMRFLERVTDPNTLIGMTGGGTTAYFINGRTIVNMDGLINGGEYFELLKSENGARFWDEAGLDYVFGRPYTLLESDPYGKMLAGRLSPLVSFSGRTLYKYETTGNNNK